MQRTNDILQAYTPRRGVFAHRTHRGQEKLSLPVLPFPLMAQAPPAALGHRQVVWSGLCVPECWTVVESRLGDHLYSMACSIMWRGEPQQKQQWGVLRQRKMLVFAMKTSCFPFKTQKHVDQFITAITFSYNANYFGVFICCFFFWLCTVQAFTFCKIPCHWWTPDWKGKAFGRRMCFR